MREIIDKWKINRNLLAEKMGMSKGFFNNKLSERQKYKFTEEEKERLKQILIEMRNDLEGITDIEFNHALKTLVNGDK